MYSVAPVFSILPQKCVAPGEDGDIEARRGGDTAVERETIGALWRQPLDSPSYSAKTLNSPTMNCCCGKGGFREFNFHHNWPYSTPLNAKEMCAVCAFVRSFTSSECPLAGETERERRDRR